VTKIISHFNFYPFFVLHFLHLRPIPFCVPMPSEV